MRQSDIEERCRAYIEDWGESAPQYALMLTGEWGCGKTFLVKKIIDGRNDEANMRLAWYISLFGVKKAEDIDDKLFEAAHPILGDPKKKKWYSVGYNVLKSAAKHKYGIDLKDMTEPVLKLFKKKDENPAGCQVLFVDDIERSSMDIKEIFGYFNPIIEGDTRVVFVANERELYAGNDGYMQIKEKTVGETYEIEPDYDEALENFWEEVTMKESPSSDERKKQLSDIVRILEVRNLRIVRQVVHQWAMFFRQLPKEFKEDDEFIGNLFEEYIVLSICNKKGEMHKSMDSNKQGNTGKSSALDHDGDVQKMKSAWNSYKEKRRNRNKGVLGEADIKEIWGTGKINYPLRYAELWPYILMKGKDADGAWLRDKMQNSYREHQEMLRLREASKRNIERLKTLTFYQPESHERDIKEIFECVLQEFDDGKYTRFDEIIQYVQTYLTLMHGKILPNTYGYDFLEKQLNTFLKNHKDKISALPEFERVQRKQIMRFNHKGIQKCINEIFDAAKEVTGTSEKQILEHREKFLKFISNPDRAVTDWVNIPFLCQIDTDKVFEWLGDDFNAHKHLLKFLEYRYRKDFGNDKLHETDYPDFPHVESLHAKYSERCRGLEHSFRLDFRDYSELRDKYGELIQYMKDVMNQNCQNN